MQDFSNDIRMNIICSNDLKSGVHFLLPPSAYRFATYYDFIFKSWFMFLSFKTIYSCLDIGNLILALGMPICQLTNYLWFIPGAPLYISGRIGCLYWLNYLTALWKQLGN